MEKQVQKESKLIWILKSLLAAYLVTGILLVLLLTFLLYQFELDEQKVTAGIVVIYVVSTFVGGLILGKLTKVKRFAWGLTLGVVYFVLLLLISLGIYRGIDGNWSNILTTFLMCAGGGMFGGMIS